MDKNRHLFDGSTPQINKGTSFNSTCNPFQYGPVFQYKTEMVEEVDLLEDEEDNKRFVNQIVALDDA